MPFQPYIGTFSFDVKLNFETNIDDVAKEIEVEVLEAIQHGWSYLKDNFFLFIVSPMVYGAPGWYSIKDTACWKWLNSPQGYAQMGFASRAEPDKLYKAYLNAWQVNLTPNGMGIDFGFGDIEYIRRQTIHPFAGKLNLPSDRSWFDWIYKGLHYRTEPAKFRRTGPKPGVRSSTIAGTAAGRMIKYNKEGSEWSIPPRYLLDMDYFLDRNYYKIRGTMESIISNYLFDYFEGQL